MSTNIINFRFNVQMSVDKLKTLRKAVIMSLIQHLESQPQNHEFRINP